MRVNKKYMLQIILNKILLGISLAAPIGPVNAEMIKRGLAYGFWAAFNIRLGGALTNSICLLIAYFSLGQLAKHQTILLAVSSIGELVLIYMGVTTIIKACSQKNFISITNNQIKEQTNTSKPTLKNGLLTGMVLASASPIGIMFWLTSFAATISLDTTIGLNITDLLINFFIIVGVLSWGCFVSGLLHFGNKIIGPRSLRIVSGLSGILLIYFGVKYGLYTLKHL